MLVLLVASVFCGRRFLQIADYKSSDEESEEESPSSKRKAPGWTSSPALRAALNNMGAIDSDAYVTYRSVFGFDV